MQVANTKGVRQKTWDKRVAEIREPNRGARLWLGTFDACYDAAARKLYGSDANLNLHHHLMSLNTQEAVEPIYTNDSIISPPKSLEMESYARPISIPNEELRPFW